MTPLKFQIAFDVFGLDEPTTGRLWDAIARSGHPLAKRLWWTFVREDTRRSRGFARRLAAVLTVQTPQQWSRMLEHLVETGRLTQRESTMVLECLLPLIDAAGAWR